MAEASSGAPLGARAIYRTARRRWRKTLMAAKAAGGSRLRWLGTRATVRAAGFGGLRSAGHDQLLPAIRPISLDAVLASDIGRGDQFDVESRRSEAVEVV